MFDQLFVRSDALTRYLSAPLVDERRQYLTHCAVQGMTKPTLEAKARLLLSIVEYPRMADRPSDTISLSDIKKAATRWSNHNWPSPQSSNAKRSREYFTAQAVNWLTFLNRFRTPPKPATVYDQRSRTDSPEYEKPLHPAYHFRLTARDLTDLGARSCRTAIGMEPDSSRRGGSSRVHAPMRKLPETARDTDTFGG
jgi:hypothetical protein